MCWNTSSAMSETVCTTCLEGFYLNNDEGKCIEIMPNPACEGYENEQGRPWYIDWITNAEPEYPLCEAFCRVN